MAMKDPLAAQQARADWRPWVEGARARAEWRADLRVSRLVQPAWSQSAELTFTVLFTTECCLKMVAMGLAFESKTTYFRDAWNWLDALTVGVAWLALLPDAGNLSSLRSIRVLRPLRTVQRVKGMRATRPGLPNSAPSRTTSTGAPSRPTAASTAHARRLETKLKELQVGQARQPPSGWLEGDAHQLSAVEFEAVAVGVIDSAVPADDSRGGARQVPPQVVRRQKPKPSRARR